MTQQVRAVPEIFNVINTVTSPSRAKIIELISHEDVTFVDLRNRTGMSKSSLSENLLRLAKMGFIRVDPSRVGPIIYNLSPHGKLVYGCLHALGSTLIRVPTAIERVVMDNEGFVKLFEENEVDDVKAQFIGKKILVPLKSYIKIVDWLDEKIATEEDPKKFEQIEQFFNDEEHVQIVKDYVNLEKSLDTECYMRRHKKLTPEQAELVAIAQDQDAVIVSTHDKVIGASSFIGLQVFDFDNLWSYFKMEKSFRIGKASSNVEESPRPVRSISGDETFDLGWKEINEPSDSSSRTQYHIKGLGESYTILSTHN